MAQLSNNLTLPENCCPSKYWDGNKMENEAGGWTAECSIK